MPGSTFESAGAVVDWLLSRCCGRCQRVHGSMGSWGAGAGRQACQQLGSHVEVLSTWHAHVHGHERQAGYCGWWVAALQTRRAERPPKGLVTQQASGPPMLTRNPC